MVVRHLVLGAVLATAACSSISTVRVQPETVYVGPHLRPIAVIHAQVTSAYLFWIPIPGHVDLDHVVNRMLLATAKALGADRVVDIQVDITPDTGIWTLRKLIGYRSATASGVAVMVEPEPGAAASAGGGVAASATTKSGPRDATRGGVNRPALPGERGRESPLWIDAARGGANELALPGHPPEGGRESPPRMIAGP
jgi:hypothetical protein